MKLLVADYDNTYELHYDGINLEKIFIENKTAVDLFMQKNIFVIATGRHFDAMRQTIDDKNLEFNYLCCNNGAEIYDKNYRLIYTLGLDNQSIEVVKKLESLIDIYYRSPFESDEITSINIYFEFEDEFDLVREYLLNNLKNCYIEFKFPKIKILNSKCNKVKAVDILKGKLNLNGEDIFTIGDDDNDIEMIKKYNGYSLTSAKKEVRKYAKDNFDSLSDFVYEKILNSTKNS